MAKPHASVMSRWDPPTEPTSHATVGPAPHRVHCPGSHLHGGWHQPGGLPGDDTGSEIKVRGRSEVTPLAAVPHLTHSPVAGMLTS